MVVLSNKMKSKTINVKKTIKKRGKHARVLPKQNMFGIKKTEIKLDENGKNFANKTLLVAQEIKFARLLANNNKKVRDNVLKNLKKWLVMRSQSSFAFVESDFMRLWKGLFYCMWMSDKPLIQEDLAESLSKIVHCFNSMDTALLYTKCTFKSLAIEWFGLDKYRIDKFEMLVKRILRQTFEMCKRQSWNNEWIHGVTEIIEEILIDPKTCLGLNLHITDIYMEELAKISKGKMEKNIVTYFVKPFVVYLASVDDQRQIKQINANIFRYLIFQSDIGMDYTEKFNTWKQIRFTCKSIDDLQKIEVLDHENSDIERDINDNEDLSELDRPLDPRAGRVDVEIPQLSFDPIQIVSLLKDDRFHKLSTTKSRKIINRLINEFTKFSEGEMPIGIKEIDVPEKTSINSYKAAKDLINFDQDLYADSNKNSNKRKRNDNTTKYSENFDNIEELVVPKDVQYESLLCVGNKKKTLINSDKSKQKSKKSVKQSMKLNLVKKINNKTLKSCEAITSKEFKKTSKVCSKYIEECKTESCNVSDNNGSTSCNWNVDIPPSISCKLATSNIVLGRKKNTNKKILNKNVSEVINTNTPWLTPVVVKLEEQNKTVSNQSLEIGPTKKRVQIKLQRNTVGNISEYIRHIKENPHIPYDANRKPKASVLKPSPLPSPINPFYKRKLI